MVLIIIFPLFCRQNCLITWTSLTWGELGGTLRLYRFVDKGDKEALYRRWRQRINSCGEFQVLYLLESGQTTLQRWQIRTGITVDRHSQGSPWACRDRKRQSRQSEVRSIHVMMCRICKCYLTCGAQYEASYNQNIDMMESADWWWSAGFISLWLAPPHPKIKLTRFHHTMVQKCTECSQHGSDFI